MADDLSTVACGGPPTGKTAGNQRCVTFSAPLPNVASFSPIMVQLEMSMSQLAILYNDVSSIHL
jgi:hypothetical protein